MSEVITDFYIRYAGHPKFTPDELEINTPLDSIISKLEIILFTNNNEVLGQSDLGCNLEYYLYKTFVDAFYVETIIQKQIQTYIPELREIAYSVTAEFIAGYNSDALLITIILPETEISAMFYDPTYSIS